MKRTLYAGLMAATAFLAGCQDYPSTGVVDTRELRERATVEEITGQAFGMKESAVSAVTAYQSAASDLNYAKERLWRQYGETGDASAIALDLNYPGVDKTQISGLLDQVKAQVVASYDGVSTAIETEVSEAKQGIQDAKAELVALNKADAAFKAATASEQKAYDQAVQDLEAVQNQMREQFHDTGVKIVKLAERVGFTGRRSLSVNPKILTRYKTRDYNGVAASQQPKECPPLRGHEPIDTRDLNGMCAYIHVGTIFTRDPDVERDARTIYREGFRNFAELMVKAGDDGSNGARSGLHAKIDTLKAELNNAYAEAAKTHGNKQERDQKIATLNRKIQTLTAQVEKAQSEDYREDLLSDAKYDLKYPEGFYEARKAYDLSMISDLFQNHIVALSDIRMNPESDVPEGYFENVEGDYAYLVTVSDILAEKHRNKQVLRSFGMASLTAPEVTEADVIKVSVDFGKLDNRGRDGSREKMQQDLLEYLDDVLDKA